MRPKSGPRHSPKQPARIGRQRRSAPAGGVSFPTQATNIVKLILDGVVISFADITAAETLETKLRANQTGLAKRVADHTTKLARQKGRSRP